MSNANNGKKGNKLDTLKLTPSQCAQAIRAMALTKRSTFIWGPPGISKSATAQQVAAELGMGFSDVRLSQMDPTDLRGLPYPVVENGVHGVRWSAPVALPRDLLFNQVATIDTEEFEIRFENPFLAKPEITVKSITKGLTAYLVSSDYTSLVVKLVTAEDADKIDSGKLDLADADPQAGKVRWTITGKVKAILALEEFNSAPPSVQAAAYQLVLDRKLGEYEVPEGVVILAMGNRDTDKGVTFKMPTPVANRFVHIEMQPDFDDWQRWALLNNVHRDVVGYLTAFKAELFEFDAGTAARGFATPRSWHAVSDILHANEDIHEMVLLGLISGSVGDGVAFKFLEFRKVAAELPKAELILSGQLKTLKQDRTQVALAYALTTSLIYELAERARKVKASGDKEARKQWLKEADNFLEFMMKNMVPEICIMACKSSISIYKLPFDTQGMKHFDTFASEYKDFIMG